jgi:hypothetical protein
MRKQCFSCMVSVPLRGLSSWKVNGLQVSIAFVVRFSPLAGIKFVESFAFREVDKGVVFQSPCGD